MADNEGYSFALCLSHDIDRVYKTYQYITDLIARRDPRELVGFLSGKNPFWTFERIMAIESDFGVRSAFNMLDEMHITERPTSEWMTKEAWKLYAGRYDVTEPQIASVLRVLDTFGWEIALHGSYTSSTNPYRFEREKSRIESAAQTVIIGNRQHYWRLSQPDTWEHLRDVGIKYDTSLGDTSKIGFQYGHELLRPFDDEFVVFPWSMMDGALMDSGDTTAEIWANCKDVLAEAEANRSVLVADWHGGRPFSDGEKEGWRLMYERMIEYALDRGAWVGPPGSFYEAVEHPDGTVAETLENLAT